MLNLYKGVISAIYTHVLMQQKKPNSVHFKTKMHIYTDLYSHAMFIYMYMDSMN